MNLANPKVKDINLDDITVSLNRLTRFNGHGEAEGLSVAKHTILVLTLAQQHFPNNPALVLNCLMHDWGEAYYGDITSPIKTLLGEAFRQMAKPIDDAIYQKYWFLPDDALTEEVKQQTQICDLLALDIEKSAMWKSQSGKKYWPVVEDAEGKFATTLEEKQALFAYLYHQGNVRLDAIYDEFLSNKGKEKLIS